MQILMEKAGLPETIVTNVPSISCITGFSKPDVSPFICGPAEQEINMKLYAMFQN